MSPIIATGSHFSNSAELLGLRGRIFPTPKVRLLFKDLSYSNLQRPIFDSLTYHTKTHLATSWKPHPKLPGFSVSEFKKLGLTSPAAVLFSNAKFDEWSEFYAENLFHPGNRGTRPHPSVTQAFRPFLSLLAPSPLSRPRRPHPLTRRGELATRTGLFPRDSPKSRPAGDSEAYDAGGGDEARDPALASRSNTTKLDSSHPIAGRSL